MCGGGRVCHSTDTPIPSPTGGNWACLCCELVGNLIKRPQKQSPGKLIKPGFLWKEAPQLYGRSCCVFSFPLLFRCEGEEECHSTDAPIPSPLGGIGRAGAVSRVSVLVRGCSAWMFVGCTLYVRMWGGEDACHSTDTPIPSPTGGIGRACAVSWKSQFFFFFFFSDCHIITT
jgi:hypothetical protein